MINVTMDVTTQFNASNTAVVDVGGWEYVIIQTVNPSGTIALQGTCDGGQSNTQNESPANAANFTTVIATKVSDGTTTSSLATAGMYKLVQPPKYLKFGGASAAADKVLVFGNKPQ